MDKKEKNLKEALLKQGARQIETKGIQALSLRKLAADCQVSHVAVYRHFKNKEELLISIIPEVAQHFTDYLKTGDLSSMTARKQLIHLAHRFMAYSQDYPRLFDFLFSSPYILVTQIDDKDIASIDYCKTIIRQFIDSLEKDYDFQVVFMQLWSFILGMTMLIRQNVYSSTSAHLTQVIEFTLSFYS